MNHLQRGIALLTAGALIVLACNAPWSIRSGSGRDSLTKIRLSPLWLPPSPAPYPPENVSLHYWSLLAESALILIIGGVLGVASRGLTSLTALPIGTHPRMAAAIKGMGRVIMLALYSVAGVLIFTGGMWCVIWIAGKIAGR